MRLIIEAMAAKFSLNMVKTAQQKPAPDD